jgi:16S rRNA G527 N7-methylase RsmG
MDSTRIASLLAPFLPAPGLSPLQLEQVSTHLDLLLKWNAKINLTSVRDPDAIIQRHFGESFFLACHALDTLAIPRGDRGTLGPRPPAFEGARLQPCPDPREPNISTLPKARAQHRAVRPNSVPPHRPNSAVEDAARTASVLDLGSGAGFPGLPLKIYAPHLAITLIESNSKKATFLKEVARANRLTDINVLTLRADDYAARLRALPPRPTHGHIHTKESADHSRAQQFPVAALLTLRAVERFDEILPLAADLLAPAGHIALLIGASQLARARQLLPAFTWLPPLPLPLSQSRLLLLGRAA